MMAVLDQATRRRRAVQAFFVLLLLTFSCYALASNSPISGNVKSRRCSPDVKVHDRTERKLAAVPASEPAVSGNASAPSPSNPRPPLPPPNSRPALISPSDDDTPGTDLPPRILSPSPASEAPITSQILADKLSNVALTLGGLLEVLVFSLVFSLACLCGVSLCRVLRMIVLAYWKPEWLPCCQPRSSQLIQYERHVPT